MQIVEVAGKTQDRHDLGGDGDVETCLARETVGDTTQAGGDLAQGAVVHVHHTAPDDAADVDIQFIAPIDVVVDHRRQQVVGRGDRVEVTGEVQVHVLHRHDLRIAATGSATLHAEAWPERGFANADRRLLADGIQPVTQTDGRGRLALAGGGRVDRGDKDQLAVGAVLHAVDQALADLGLVVAVRQQIVAVDAQLGTDVLNGTLAGRAGDLDIGFVFHGWLP